MSDKAASRLDIPARKVLINSLYQAESVPNNTVIPDLHNWKIDNKTCSIVWIQGRVTKLFEGGTFFTVDDDTAVAEVDCSNVPVGCPKPQLDRYMMVIGELLSVQPCPTIKAMKLQDLSDYNQAKMIWPLEVQDLDNFLSSQTK